MTDLRDRSGAPDPVDRLDQLGIALAAKPPAPRPSLPELQGRADRQVRHHRRLAAVATVLVVGAVAAVLAWATADDGTRLDVSGAPPGPPATHAPPVDQQPGIDATADPVLLSVEQAVGATVSLTIHSLSSTLVDPRAVLVERWDGDRWVALADAVPWGQSLAGATYDAWFPTGSLAPTDATPVPLPAGEPLVLTVVLPDGTAETPIAVGAPLGPGWYRLSVGLIPLEGEPDGPLPVPPRAAAQIHVVTDQEVLGGGDPQAGAATGRSRATTVPPTIAHEGATGCTPDDVACLCAQRGDRWAEGTDVVAFLMPDATDQQAAELEAHLSELVDTSAGALALLDAQTRDEAYAELERTFADQPELVESLTPADLPRAYQLGVVDPVTPDTVAQWVASGGPGLPTVQVVVVGQPNALCDPGG